MENKKANPDGFLTSENDDRHSSKPKLPDRVRNVIRYKHYSIRTEQTYTDWIKRYIFFHGRQHPEKLNENHVGEFLTHLAVQRNVAASTQNQALCAIVFLYKEVLKMPFGEINHLSMQRNRKRGQVCV
jgi:site-specific recombinase XerD